MSFSMYYDVLCLSYTLPCRWHWYHSKLAQALFVRTFLHCLSAFIIWLLSFLVLLFDMDMFTESHDELTFTLPGGGQLGRPLLVVQSSGSISSVSGTVSYRECPLGTQQNGTSCIECPEGRLLVLFVTHTGDGRVQYRQLNFCIRFANMLNSSEKKCSSKR